MRKKVEISYAWYRRIIDSNKSLRHEISTLRNQVQLMTHYWKIRCEEREALSCKRKYLVAERQRLLSVKRGLDKLFGTYLLISNGKKRGNKKTYPLFITRNDYHKLKRWLKERA